MPELEVKRSPSGKFWHVLCKGRMIACRDTKQAAKAERERLLKGLLCTPALR